METENQTDSPELPGMMEDSIDVIFPKRDDDGNPSYRRNQRETIINSIIALQTKKAVLIDAPVGAGKSAINYTIARYLGPSIYITSQKALQTQIDGENFHGTKMLQGRNAYNCPFVTKQAKKPVGADGWEFNKFKSCKKCEDTDVISGGDINLSEDIIDSIVSNSGNMYLTGMSVSVTDKDIRAIVDKCYSNSNNRLIEEEMEPQQYDTYVLKSFGCHMTGARYCCPYKVAKTMLLNADVRVMNPDNFFYNKLAGVPVDYGVNTLIFDEAHGLDDAIGRVMSQTVPVTILETKLGLDMSQFYKKHSPKAFKTIIEAHIQDLQDIAHMVVLAGFHSPLILKESYGHQNISSGDGLKDTCIHTFGKGMSLVGKDFFSVVSHGLHISDPCFGPWRDSISSFYERSGGETPGWFRDMNWPMIRRVLSHVKRTDKQAALNSDGMKTFLEPILVDMEKFFKNIKMLTQIGRGENNDLPCFVTTIESGRASYKNMTFADGYQCETETSIKLTCVDIGLILRIFYYGDKKLVFSSGSWIQPEGDIRMLGLNPSEVEHIIVPSEFPPSRRPIYKIPSIDFSGKDMDGDYVYKTVEGQAKWIRILDDTISALWEKHPGINIVIHSQTFELTQKVAELCRIGVGWMFHLNGNMNQIWNTRSASMPYIVTKEDGVEAMKSRPKSQMVLVSPSIKEGVDFFMGAASAQIILKAPTPSIGDPYVQTMMFGNADCGILPDRDFFNKRIVRDTVQMYGRVVRSKDDSGITMVMDERLCDVLAMENSRGVFKMGYVSEGMRGTAQTMKSGRRIFNWRPWS